LLSPHVVDEEHLAGSAGVHTRSVPTLVLQLVGIQSHLPVIGGRERLVFPDQRDRGCLDAGHRTASDSKDLGQDLRKFAVGDNDSGQRLMNLVDVIHHRLGL